MEKMIGKITTYHGNEFSFLKDSPVHIVSILGGGRVEVKPWIEQENRFSFVSNDPKACDLACFNTLS